VNEDSVRESAQAILDAIGSPADLTLVRCGHSAAVELATAGGRRLVRDEDETIKMLGARRMSDTPGLDFNEIDLEQLSSVRGDTALLAGCDFSRSHQDVAPRALAIAEMRFRRVIVLPCSADPSDETVADVLERTQALVFAREPESLRVISRLCESRLACDCAFFYDFSPFRDLPGRGMLNAFRSDLNYERLQPLPDDNDDISARVLDVGEWLDAIAPHEAVRTDRAEVLIAAALMGKRVEFDDPLDSSLQSIADWALGAFNVSRIARDDPVVVEPAELAPGAARTLARLRDQARSTHAQLNAEQQSRCRVSAVILTQGRPRFLRRAIDSLEDAGAAVRAVVIDNNSSAAAAPAIEAVCESRPDTLLYRSEHNLRCAGGRNLGTSLTDAEFVLFLDDDAELLPGALAHLVAELDADPDTAAVTATLVRPDGTIQHSGGAVHVEQEIINFELLGDGLQFATEALPPSGPTGWIPMTVALIRRDVLLEQPIDEQMSAYFEDNVWSYDVSRTRPRCFRRSREALALHHLVPKHASGEDFVSRAGIVRLFSSYAHFYERHGALLGPWLFDHVPELRAADGSCDRAAARLLMELVNAKGLDWILMEWMNGDLDGLLRAGGWHVALRANRVWLEESRAEVERSRADADRARAEAEHFAGQARTARAQTAHDAHTISTLDAQLNAANLRLRLVQESVTWQLFQRTRHRVFGFLGGESSSGVAALQSSLRYVGRHLRQREPVAVAQADRASPAPARPQARGPIELPTSEQPNVSIVIPLYAHAELTRAALDSIRDSTQDVRYDVILVDDAADAGTKALLSQVRGATVITNDHNVGYIRAIHRGVESARGRWLVLCNNDIEVQPGWLSALLACGESSPEVAIVAPKYVSPDGALSEAGAVIWRDGTGLNYGRGDAPTSCHYEYRREIDYGSAAALLVRRDFWLGVGGFDERFLPMYYEDTDLCFEARARDLRVMFEPRALVVHHEGATAGTDESSGHKRHQQSNRPKFVEKWHERLETEHLPNGTDGWLGATARAGLRVLVVDHRTPMWDRESGALRMRGILESLLELGCHVTFLPDNLLPMQPYTRELQRLGIEVLYGIEIPGDLERIVPGMSMVLLSRPQVAAHWLDLVRERAPDALVVYDTVDLHWLREARRATVAVGPGQRELVMTRKARAMRELELGLVRACDATIVVTDNERDQVLADVPDATVHVVPNVNRTREHVPGPEARTGVVFVGGFEHPPNLDAAVALVRDVMPLVWRELPEVPVTIVGSDPPPEVTSLAGPRVTVAGWVPDLEPLLDRSQALVAPLTYGAGLKGKVTQALASGLPVVTTPIGAEGLEATDGEELLIATAPADLAARVIRVLTDEQLWRQLSTSGRALASRTCSPSVMTARLGQLLDDAKALQPSAAATRGA
jgi:GT2 family glycosyltransferase/glycosyltransferase involved in cell wall biosynthesis